MTTTIKDLWPADFALEERTPPVTILRQQAVLIGRKTKNLVEGDVETSTTAANVFVHTFYLMAPVLDDFRYPVLTAVHDIGLYPVTVEADGKETLCANEDAFYTALQLVFTSEKTHKVITALLAQSKG